MEDRVSKDATEIIKKVHQALFWQKKSFLMWFMAVKINGM